MTGRVSAVLYNCAPPSPGRGSTRLGRELDAMVDDKPVLLGLVETVGYAMPSLRGYNRLRDSSTSGRANVTVYVRKDHEVTRSTWHDMHQTWPRTEHPGQHPARAWLEVRINGAQFLFGHQPPKLPPRSGGEPITRRCQQEGVDFLTERTAPWTREGWARRSASQQRHAQTRPRIVLADWNRGPHEDGPGQKAYAEKLGGMVTGTRIDAMVSRGVSVLSARYDSTFDGIHLGSDHTWGALRIEMLLLGWR